MTPAQSANFDRLLAPRHIAFMGGTDAAIAINEARRRGFAGQIWAINPKRDVLAGVPCIASIDALPEPPDAVYIAIPATHVIGAVRALSEMGAGGVVCYSAGFKEAHEEGAALEDALKTAAGDMAVVGPNCYGVINYIENAALWPFAHGGECPGYGAAIITQSGMFSSDITMSQRSLPLAYMVSGGNQTVLGIEDFIEAFADKPQVRAIGVHIEGLRDIPRFESACLKALQNGKPVVALKTGNSVIGAALTASHTGSLSGTKELYDALFRRVGVISVSNPSQFLETLKYLCVVGAPAGAGLAGFTCSGGGATMLADRAEQIDLSFPAFSQDLADDLKTLLPPIATVSNPLDYTTPIWGQPDKTYPAFKSAMGRDDVHAAILVQDYPATGLDESLGFYRADAIAFAKAAHKQGLPAAICATIPENMDAETRALLIDMGVAPMQGIHEALQTIKDATDWSVAHSKILEDPPVPTLGSQPDLPPVARDEAAGKAWLHQHGIRVPDSRIADGKNAAKAALDLGFPVALKMLSPSILHKTEMGTVTLGLMDMASVEAAVTDMRKALEDMAPCGYTDRFLIEAMAPRPVAELIVGIRRDPQFGFALTLGSGGILTELVADAETVLLPCSQHDIGAALNRLKVSRLLKGYRGGAHVNPTIVTDVIAKLCRAVLSEADTLVEIEINPLFVYEDGCVAVDALLSLSISAATSDPTP